MNKNLHTLELINYLASTPESIAGGSRVPPLTALGKELNISVARLREQLEVAKALGLVEVKPRTGIRLLPYSFLPAVHHSLAYAMEINKSHFDAFADLRNHLEAAFWFEAVNRLTPEDIVELNQLVESAWRKLEAPHIEIPHREHRQLHLCIFRRIDNPFVLGILEAYWEAYEAVGLNLYTGYDYLQEVWRYHQKMVDDIANRDFESGYKALVEHKDLLYHRDLSDDRAKPVT